jgi:hypothetical protein
MKRVFFLLVTVLTLAFLGCRKKCDDYPTYSLCAEQVEWFRPEGEVWMFTLNGKDTVTAKLGSVNRYFYDSKKSYPISSKKCSQSGPMVEQGSQQITFSSSAFSENLFISSDINTDTYTCLPVKYSLEAKYVYSIDSIRINNTIYYGVTKAYRDFYEGFNYTPDTVFYSKAQGLLKVSFVEIKNELERL